MKYTLRLLVALCCFLAACSGTNEIAEFDIRPVDNGASVVDEPTPVAFDDDPTQPEESATPATQPTSPPTVEDADSSSQPEPDDVEPAEGSAQEDSAQEDAAQEESAEDEAAEESADQPVEEAAEAVAVDFSRRGQTIQVQDEAGDSFARIDGDLPAGGMLEYRFDVVAGQSILIRQLGGCVFTGGNVLIADLRGPRGASGGVFFNVSSDDCTESKRYDVEESGQATLSFSNSDPGFSGSFAFEVIDVTNEPIVELAFGDVVTPDSPVPGAGLLEFPGSVDVYSFEVQAGDAYLIRQLGCELENTSTATFSYEGAGNGTSFLHAGRCDDSDRYEARSSGTVLIYANGGSNHEGTGTYSFELVDLNTADSIALQFGDVVEVDSPAPGAGNIEQPGERDKYTLEMLTGQTVVLIQQGGCAFEGGNVLAMEIEGAGVDTNFFFHDDADEGGCFDVKRITAEFDDTVTMLVRDSSSETTGTYTFEVGSGSETVEEAEAVLDDLDAVDGEAEDERLITLDETVLFDFGSAELKANANQALADVADVLGVYNSGEIRIVGHTDAVGSDADNERLSQRRAEAVVTALADLGVDDDRMVAIGNGEQSPVAPNENDDGSDNPDGRAANRRVEIFFSAQA